MRNDLTIAQFSQFLKDFEKLGAKLTEEEDKFPDIKIPPFTMPNWTDPGKNLEINLGLRRVWILTRGLSEKVMKIKKRTVAVELLVDQKGFLTITCRHPLDMKNELTYFSGNAGYTLNCFIIFSQLLKPITRGVTKQLKNIYRTRGVEKNQYPELINSMERSLESLVPFIVADKLTGQ